MLRPRCYGARPMARKQKAPVAREDAKGIGDALRTLRRTAGYASVEKAVESSKCPAARQTIYAYERGALTPSLPQFLDLVEFYALRTPKAPPEIRDTAVSVVVRALTLPVFHVTEAMALIAELQAPEKG